MLLIAHVRNRLNIFDEVIVAFTCLSNITSTQTSILFDVLNEFGCSCATSVGRQSTLDISDPIANLAHIETKVVSYCLHIGTDFIKLGTFLLIFYFSMFTVVRYKTSTALYRK